MTEVTVPPVVHTLSQPIQPPAKPPSSPKISLENNEDRQSAEKPAAVEPTPLKTMALVVDDELANRDFLARLLQQAGLEVRSVGSAKQALEIVDEFKDRLALVMLDYQLVDQRGPELLKMVRERLPNAKIVMATMYDDRALIRESFTLGCTAFLVKPHGFMELFHLVSKAVKAGEALDCLNQLIFDQYGSRTFRA